jgi:hypothetical protein
VTVLSLLGDLGVTVGRVPAAVGNVTVRCFANPESHKRDDRHPSMTISLDHGAWLCRGCGARGSVLDLARLVLHDDQTARAALARHHLDDDDGAWYPPTPVQRRRRRAWRSATRRPR